MKRPRPLFALRAKKPFHTGVRTGCHYLNSLSVCLRMCSIRRFYGLRELYEAGFTHTGSKEAGEYGLTRGTCFVARRLELVAVAGPLWI